MKFVDRRFLFPVVAVTAWAQQPAQSNPAAAQAEAELRARAGQFFQLQVDKKYRQAEALVAEDTKDTYYNGMKFNIKNFNIQDIELLDNNTRAKVTMKSKVTLVIPGAASVDIDAPLTSLWKLENGQWVWYIDPAAAVQTPFGPVKPGTGDGAIPPMAAAGKAPDISTLQHLVTIDPKSVVLTAKEPQQTVTVSNGLPGGVDLELRPEAAEGFKAEIEKKHLGAGEKTLIHITSTSPGTGERSLQVLVSPLGAQLDLRVVKK